jgi:hypothetical protein
MVTNIPNEMAYVGAVSCTRLVHFVAPLLKSAPVRAIRQLFQKIPDSMTKFTNVQCRPPCCRKSAIRNDSVYPRPHRWLKMASFRRHRVQEPITPGASSAVFKIAGGIAVFLLCFWGTLFLLDTSADKELADPDACPGGAKTVLTKPYPLLEGYAYKAALPSLASLSDSNANLFHSPALLCEDNEILGPPHTFHAEIVKIGFGRFSHFGDSVVFSSSDNSDPNSNGRQYIIVIPSERR